MAPQPWATTSLQIFIPFVFVSTGNLAIASGLFRTGIRGRLALGHHRKDSVLVSNCTGIICQIRVNKLSETQRYGLMVRFRVNQRCS